MDKNVDPFDFFLVVIDTDICCTVLCLQRLYRCKRTVRRQPVHRQRKRTIFVIYLFESYLRGIEIPERKNGNFALFAHGKVHVACRNEKVTLFRDPAKDIVHDIYVRFYANSTVRG